MLPIVSLTLYPMISTLPAPLCAIICITSCSACVFSLLYFRGPILCVI